MLLKRRIVLAAMSFLLAGTLCSAQQALDNAAVLKLAKSGLSEDLIVQTINASAGHYDTGTDALIALKQAGITDKEVGAMLMKNANPNGPAQAQMPTTIMIAAPPPALPGVTEVGVYLKDKNGDWNIITSENVNFKTGGVLKSAFSDGIVKPDTNGHLSGPESKLKVTQPVEIAIYVFEGQDAGNYQLLHLHAHKDGREFRSVTGGVFHASGGAQRDEVEFKAKRIAPRVYVVTMPEHMEPGEYGFLPPGTMNTGRNMASSGEMYTFTITE